MIFILKEMVRGNGPEMAQNRAGEKLGQIPAERHRRADRHKETANRAIPEWVSVETPPKPFYEGRFSEIMRVTDGKQASYAVFDDLWKEWVLLGHDTDMRTVVAWKPVKWVQGY